MFKIVSEGAIAAGTRRIEVVVSKAAFEYMNERVKEMDKLSQMFKVHSEEVIERVEKLQEENKAGIEFMSQKLGECIIILASEKTVAVKVSDSFVKKGVNAGKIVGEIARATGANGGGRPNFAQGGVKDSSKLDEILSKIEDELKR